MDMLFMINRPLFKYILGAYFFAKMIYMCINSINIIFDL